MNIAPIQNFTFKSNLKNRIKNSPSFGDMDYGDRVTIISSAKKKPREIRILTPEWEIINTQFKMLRHKHGNIENLGKELMQEGWSMKFSAKALQEKAAQLAQDAKGKELKDAMTLYEETKTHNFEEYRNSNHEGYWSKREIEKDWQGVTITEYDDDDEFEVLRKLRVTDEKIIYEDVRYFSGLIDEYVFDAKTGELLSLTLGKREMLNGGYKAEECYEYDTEGNLFSYSNNYKITKNGDETADEFYLFTPELISKYYQNYFNGGKENTTSASKILYFKEGSCSGADLGFREVGESQKTISKQYLFDTHGNIDACACELKEKENGLISAPTIYMYENGILNKAATKYEAYKDNKTVSAQKLYTFILGGAQGGSCYVKNMGLLGENYQISECRSEKVANYLGV